MARIRSLHPSQWDDDDFCDLSFAARLLALALRNHADDRGIFEWKPRQIKIACMPADALEIEPLLAELMAPKMEGPHRGHGRVIEPFSVGGRRFGAIRNFGRWQRVQKPKPVHPHPPELNDYSALASSAPLIPGIDAFPGGVIIGIASLETGGSNGIPIQRKEEGGRRKESIPYPSGTGAEPAPKAPSGDDKTWLFNEGLAYLAEASGKKPAQLRALAGRWLKDLGDDPAKLRSTIEECAKLEAADPIGWITKALAARKAAPSSQPSLYGQEREDDYWRLCMKGFVGKAHVWDRGDGPPPGSIGCNVPEHILAEFRPQPAGTGPQGQDRP